MTVIALVLGLTVVALQLSSTQFSPRLLRKFLRDRANQVVLSVFVATFVYSSAGLYTVGLAAGARVEEFPRLAVSGAIVLLFASMAMVVYFADHLAHSIQVDAIGARVEKDTLAVVRGRLGGVVEDTGPTPPAWAVAVPAARSGYLQTVHPDPLLALGAPDTAGDPVACPGGRTHRRRHRPRLGVDRDRRPPAADPAVSGPNWIGRSGSGSNGPWNRTRRSGSGNWSTWPARPCLRR